MVAFIEGRLRSSTSKFLRQDNIRQKSFTNSADEPWVTDYLQLGGISASPEEAKEALANRLNDDNPTGNRIRAADIAVVTVMPCIADRSNTCPGPADAFRGLVIEEGEMPVTLVLKNLSTGGVRPVAIVLWQLLKPEVAEFMMAKLPSHLKNCNPCNRSKVAGFKGCLCQGDKDKGGKSYSFGCTSVGAKGNICKFSATKDLCLSKVLSSRKGVSELELEQLGKYQKYNKI